jgi:hypothetical protein
MTIKLQYQAGDRIIDRRINLTGARLAQIQRAELMLAPRARIVQVVQGIMFASLALACGACVAIWLGSGW